MRETVYKVSDLLLFFRRIMSAFKSVPISTVSIWTTNGGFTKDWRRFSFQRIHQVEKRAVGRSDTDLLEVQKCVISVLGKKRETSLNRLVNKSLCILRHLCPRISSKYSTFCYLVFALSIIAARLSPSVSVKSFWKTCLFGFIVTAYITAALTATK